MLNFAVVPLVGTWIEIYGPATAREIAVVVPLVGTWIEIEVYRYCLCGCNRSFPSWERGLKSVISSGKATIFGRSPRGNVD